VGPDDVGQLVEADKAFFGTAFIGSFDTFDSEGGLVHRCMVVGQHYKGDRRVSARCGRSHPRATVRRFPTCVVCIAYVQERNMPL
jgi:hypothetical protein